jgi:formylglycine-generating enzyme required for sulfatase activity
MRVAAVLIAFFAAPAALQAITIETVAVGNAGNAADLLNQIPRGAVGYDFNLGKFEVTNAQYVAFLNGVDPAGTNDRQLYNSQMSSDARGGISLSSFAASGFKYSTKAGRANNPVVFVSFFDAARFTNWLHNGQGNGNTENGSYQLDGGTPIPTNADFVDRKLTASWCVPTLDEWYKAAYHKNDGLTDHYWAYPTASDTAPASDQPPGTDAPTPANTANFNLNDAMANGYNDGFAVTGSPAMVAATNYLSDAGAYSLALGPYGTYDQGGNVWEWNETSPSLEARAVAGGSWINTPSFLASSASNSTLAESESNTIGFRVARVTPQTIPGDYNIDGQVDAADYTIWRNSLGSTNDLRANGDNTGASMNVIDAADYDFWKTHFGEPAGAAAAAAQSVPEPTTLLLLILGIALLTTARSPTARGLAHQPAPPHLDQFAPPRNGSHRGS